MQTNKITRENMNNIVEEIMEIMNSDWLSEDSKSSEIEHVIVNNGLATVNDEEKENELIY